MKQSKASLLENKIRICLVVPTFPKLSETFIANKLQGLIERDQDVHLVCTTSPEGAWVQFPKLNTAQVRNRVHRMWPVSPRWLARLLIPISMLRCLVRQPVLTTHYLVEGWPLFGWRTPWQLYQDAEIICLAPDILHFEFGAPAAKKMYLKELLECKVVVSFRGYDLNFSGLEQAGYYQPVWEKADALHLLGEDLWQRALRRGCPENKVHALIPPAIDSTTFSPTKGDEQPGQVGSQERPLRILSVGRLEWKKGYEVALLAVKMLVEEGICCQYRVLGGGEYLEALAFARHQLCLEEVVEFLGTQSHSEVQHQMKWADVFLHTAVSEGFSNAVLEAQAMQLPVVCSDADGLAENVHNEVSGFVVTRRNPKALAGKLLQLANDPSLRQKMGSSGRKRVKENFALEQQIEQFQNFYVQIINPNTSL